VVLGAGSLNLGQFTHCPSCQTQLWVEVFPALFRRIAPVATDEAVMIAGESACFYHDAKKAVVICDGCGRFLCTLCDCFLEGQHYCPPCLESGDRKRSIAPLEKSRPLHARQAMVLAILPFFVTGLIALFLAIRYWKAPGSLVRPQRWIMPTALILASLQTIVYLFLIIGAFVA
jgi:hypothetical protein